METLFLIVVIILIYYFYPRESFATRAEKHKKLSDWFSVNPKADYLTFKQSFKDVNILDYEKYRYNVDLK